jgi:class 3 adenylate cyclase/tetratricopeptide (TPR) repeat protein
MRTCPSCAHGNPDDARFCASCGAALVAPSPREVRKTVTVLFADVTGSTALGERLDPESFRRVMALYFETARACLERHGATVEKFIGDAVMAVFGVPVVHEDDALRAVRAASELRSSISALNEDLETDYGVSLHVRIGVNTGEVIVGTEERLATGDAVNVAARLEQSAEPDEILLGEETFRLARDAIEVEPAGDLILKGKADPITAHRLMRVVEGAQAFERRLDAPLVGRRVELDRVHAAFERAVAERRCQLVTVLGAAGIGKSRLAREVATELRGDAVVLEGRCLPYGEGITFWPLREIFVAAGAEEELDVALAAGAAEETFWAVRKSIEHRARESPLALIVQDIHWAEPTLLDLIEHLVDWTRDAQLLVLCLARPDLLDERPGWAAGRPNADTVTLDPLGEGESNELIAGLLGETRLEGRVRRRIQEVAEGNPLFVEQLVASLTEGGDVERVPSTIQALLASRLDMLSETERDVLERASVVGVEFEWEALTRLDPDGRRASGGLLSALARKDLIRAHEAIEDTFRFRHVLIRDAAYERISKRRRADLHERVADWLDERGEEFDEIVGHHFEQAYRCLSELGPPGDRGRLLAEKGAVRLATSGLRANNRGDSQAAQNLLERAISLLPSDDRRRLALLPVLGRALREAGHLERADTVLAEAVEQAKAAGERAIAADAAVSLADLRFHRHAYTGFRREDVLREIDMALRVFEEDGDEAGMGRALCLAGKLGFWAGEAAATTAVFERAARHSRDAGDKAEEAESLQYVIGTILSGPLPVDEALQRIEELRAPAALNQRLQVALLEASGQLEAMRGQFDAARGLIARARTSAREAGLEGLLDTRAAGTVEFLAGDAAAAERELRPGCESLEQKGELGFLSSLAPLLADALFEQGRDDEALTLTERWHVDRLTVPEDVDAQVGWRRVRAKLSARNGDLEEAVRLGRQAVAMARGTDFLDLQAMALADLGEVLRLAGQPTESADASHEALRLYEAKGNVAAAGKLRARLAASQVDASAPSRPDTRRAG